MYLEGRSLQEFGTRISFFKNAVFHKYYARSPEMRFGGVFYLRCLPKFEKKLVIAENRPSSNDVSPTSAAKPY